MNLTLSPVLFNLWGPLSIHAYGAFIALGVTVAWTLAFHDKKLRKIISIDDFTVSFQLMLLSGFFGGRIVSMLSQPETIHNYFDFFKFWEPGFSILGSIIGITVVLGIYLYLKKITILPYADRICVYAPLVQSFGRMGCFFTGCCYGCPSSSWLTITYQSYDHMAPLCQSLHPAQLYSSFLLMGLFLFLFFIGQYRFKKPGILFCAYLALASMERFLIDFIRWDRDFTAHTGFFSYLSIHQWIALAVFSFALVSFVALTKWTKPAYGSV